MRKPDIVNEIELNLISIQKELNQLTIDEMINSENKLKHICLKLSSISNNIKNLRLPEGSKIVKSEFGKLIYRVVEK